MQTNKSPSNEEVLSIEDGAQNIGMWADISRSTHHLEWSPKTSMYEGIVRTLNEAR